MNVTPKNTKKSRIYILLLVCILTAAIFILAPVASGKEYIPPGHEYTVNYYKAYGEPDIYASVLGDTEFERGETATIKVILSNKGVLYGFKSIQSGDSSDSTRQQSMAELEYEVLKTTAYGIKTHLVSPTDLIKIDASTNSQILEELLPGDISEEPFSFTVEISENAPAGTYILEMPLDYEYQEDVQMTGGEVVRLGLPGLDHATYYKTAQHTIQIPVIVKPAAKFEVVEVSGNLTAGAKDTINVTYINSGELQAQEAVARLVVMRPLSTDGSMKSLGTMLPGESKTVSFVISSDFLAVEKNYGIDSEVKYIDEDGEDTFSESMKVNVRLEKPEGKVNVTYLAIFGIVIMGIVLIIKNTKKNGSKEFDN
jgi:hypothetical protein